MSEDVYRELLRNMTPGQKLRVTEEMYWEARALKAAGFRMLHPDWTEEQVQAAVRDMVLYGRT